MGNKRSFSESQALQQGQNGTPDYASWYAFARECAVLPRPASAQIGLGISATHRLLHPVTRRRKVLFEDGPTGLGVQEHSIVQVDNNSHLGYWTVRADGQARFAWQEMCQRGCAGFVSVTLTTLSPSRFQVSTVHGSRDDCERVINQVRAETSQESLVACSSSKTMPAKDAFTSNPSRLTSYKFSWQCTLCHTQFSCHLGQVRPYTMAILTSTLTVPSNVSETLPNPCTWSLPTEIQWALWHFGIDHATSDFSPDVHESDYRTLDEISFSGQDVLEQSLRWYAQRTDLYCRPYQVQLIVQQYHKPVAWQSPNQNRLQLSGPGGLERLERYLETFSSGLRGVDAFEHRCRVARLGCFGLNFDLEMLARELAPEIINAIVEANQGKISVDCIRWATLHYDDLKRMLALERRGTE